MRRLQITLGSPAQQLSRAGRSAEALMNAALTAPYACDAAVSPCIAIPATECADAVTESESNRVRYGIPTQAGRDEAHALPLPISRTAVVNLDPDLELFEPPSWSARTISCGFPSSARPKTSPDTLPAVTVRFNSANRSPQGRQYCILLKVRKPIPQR